MTEVTLDGRTRRRFGTERTAWPSLRGYDTLLLLREALRTEKLDFLREFLRTPPERQGGAEELDRKIFRSHMMERGTRLFSVLCGMAERGEISAEEMRWAVFSTPHGDMASLKAMLLPEEGEEPVPLTASGEDVLTVSADLDAGTASVRWMGQREDFSFAEIAGTPSMDLWRRLYDMERRARETGRER